MKIFFFLSTIFIAYTYIGYPLLLMLLSRLTPKKIIKAYNEPLPFVSVVIAAKNEQANIERRLSNLLEAQYPDHLYEIIVVSDGSDDMTNQIVESFSAGDSRVRLVAYSPSRGKPFALNRGVHEATGSIVVFADSRQIFDPRSITELVANFNDPDVGCVSGELVFLDGRDSSIQKEMGVYWHYEKMIRKLESRCGSVAGATGAIYAVRKDLYRDIPGETILDDVLTPMNIVMQGYRCVFDHSAIAHDRVSKDVKAEMTRKIRTLAGNWQLLKIEPGIILPFKNRIWWNFLSHKIFRLVVPFLLLFLLISNFFIVEHVFIFTLFAQLLFYIIALFAWLIPETRRHRLVNLVYFFVNLNYAALVGTFYFLSGNTSKTWKRAC